MRKLRQFQELGHEVMFVVGNYTSLIGDPSDQDKLRPRLTPEQVAQNSQTYAEQAGKVLDRANFQVKYNADWLAKMSFEELIKLAANFTLQQFLTRETFRLRWERGDAIYLHETFYSLMQGYDAFHLEADIQVGGTDQLFNIMTAARKVMTSLGGRPNIAIILGILPGTDGIIKMSKSLGNHIRLLATPEDMYGKVMSIPDQAMGQFFRLVTRWTPTEITALEEGLASGKLHPRDVKMKLAHEIVSIYHSQEAASAAEHSFIQLFQLSGLPESMPTFHLQPGQSILDVLIESGLLKSRSEARRLCAQHGVRLDGVVLDDPHLQLQQGGVLQAGKRRFMRIILGDSDQL
jgi:tyrosyl-tRNA synthetase